MYEGQQELDMDEMVEEVVEVDEEEEEEEETMFIYLQTTFDTFTNRIYKNVIHWLGRFSASSGRRQYNTFDCLFPELCNNKVSKEK